MKIQYTSSVKTPAGWRSVEIIADALKLSEKRCEILSIYTIDGESPNYNQSRTGAKRQSFNGVYFANAECGKKKNISSLKIIED